MDASFLSRQPLLRLTTPGHAAVRRVEAGRRRRRGTAPVLIELRMKRGVSATTLAATLTLLRDVSAVRRVESVQVTDEPVVFLATTKLYVKPFELYVLIDAVFGHAREYGLPILESMTITAQPDAVALAIAETDENVRVAESVAA